MPDFNSFAYKQRLLEIREAVDEIELPRTTCNDLLRGILYGLMKYAVKYRDGIGSNPDTFVEIYGDLMMYGLASFVVRNYAGKNADRVAVVDQVASYLDSEWQTKKEEAKNLSRHYGEIAEYLEEAQPEFEFFFVIPALLPTGLVTAIKRTTIPIQDIVFCVMLFGAASGLTLGVLNDLVTHAGRVQLIFKEIQHQL